MHFLYLFHACTQVNNGGWKQTCPFHGLENKAVKWHWHSPAVEPGQILSSRIARTESSRSPRPWHFGSRLPRHLRSQQVTCYLGLLSGAWIYMTWQVLELQVMSNMHGCCIVVAELDSVGLPSQLGSARRGSIFTQNLGENKNQSLPFASRRFLSRRVNKKRIPSINCWFKPLKPLCEKVWKRAVILWRVHVCGSVCVTDRKMKEQEQEQELLQEEASETHAVIDWVTEAYGSKHKLGTFQLSFRHLFRYILPVNCFF